MLCVCLCTQYMVILYYDIISILFLSPAAVTTCLCLCMSVCVSGLPGECV